ncbi:hypothetical protein M3201_08470 [Paenibacillus motobuensis]|uniref:hypothetical protein n=1 Tax=Paenibacillus TaxID=44249 RepID=UPI00203C9E2B|nr:MULTISPECIES: hypothetical protein [Paenibacillus]MCM3039730.1 hypothetical protein [Paenibacillus lutimineralis]MCM3646834.1 hypothetical protein [Paenibacillus motobuensis]
MKKLIFIFCILLFLVSCSSKGSPLDFMESVQSTNLSAETGGLEFLNASEQEVIAQRGEPLDRGEIQVKSQQKSREVVLEYDNYQYILAEGRVVSYSLKPGQETAKQLKIGDDEARIAELYGENYYTRKQDKLCIKGYLDKENKRVIEFIVDQNKVAMVVVSELSWFNK